MRVDAIGANDMYSPYYLEQMGLSHLFSSSSVGDNSPSRGTQNNWRYSDLSDMIGTLGLSQNKYYIIRLLQRGDIMRLVRLLDKNKLLKALNLFPKSKLMHFMHQLPKDIVLKMLLYVIPLKMFLQLFPSEMFLNILRSKRLNVGDMLQNFENVPLESLQWVVGQYSGRDVSKLQPRELKSMFFQINKDQIIETMKSMPEKQMLEYIYQMVRKDPELLMGIPRGEMLKVASTVPKSTMVEMFRLLPETMLCEYMNQLPDKQLAMAASQIDENALGAFLMNNFPDLILQLASAA